MDAGPNVVIAYAKVPHLHQVRVRSSRRALEAGSRIEI